MPDEIRKEPVAVIDITGSMGDAVAPHSTMTKKQLLENIMNILTQDLAGLDTQGGDEASGGGLYTIWFADGNADEIGFDREAVSPEKPYAKGDLNSANFTAFWRTLPWGGGTYIEPALNLVDEHMHEEFESKIKDSTRWPVLALAIITDGKLFDMTEANAWLRSRTGNAYVLTIVVGSDDAQHQAVEQWNAIAATNKHVRVVDAHASVDAHALAQELLSMFS